MKYVPLKNKPNISESKLESISPSLKMDDRGYPCISWLDKGNNVNEVKYSYWDGLKWSFYNVPKVYISNENIVFSPNALVLDLLDSPMIVFARKMGSGYRLSLAHYESGWDFSDYDVTYEVGWVGVIRYDGPVGINSSSSFSSSSSSNSHSIYFVAAYDIDNEQFIIYSFDSGTWTPFATKAELVDDFESLRIDVCGRRMGITHINHGSSSSSSSSSSGIPYTQNVIKYNFLDLDAATWSFSAFQNLNYSLSYGEIIDMDMAGYWETTNSIMAFGWVSRSSTASYVCSVIVQDDGTETPSNNISPVIESQNIIVTAPSDYIVNSYRKVALCIDGSNLIRMVTLGASSKEFRLVIIGLNRLWTIDLIDIEGISNGIVATSVRSGFSSDAKLVISTDSNDIYYFEPSTDDTFSLSTPDMVLLNSQLAYRATYSSGQLSGVDLAGTCGNTAGCILTDSERPLCILSGI